MNIHLITYLTSKLFWIYTVFRYNTILYPKNEDTQKLFAYFCAYLLSCWGSMQWGTMYGDLIFELIALLIITVAYQADRHQHVDTELHDQRNRTEYGSVIGFLFS